RRAEAEAEARGLRAAVADRVREVVDRDLAGDATAADVEGTTRARQVEIGRAEVQVEADERDLDGLRAVGCDGLQERDVRRDADAGDRERDVAARLDQRLREVDRDRRPAGLDAEPGDLAEVNRVADGGAVDVDVDVVRAQLHHRAWDADEPEV